MRRFLKLMLASFVLISILFLSGCRYKMFWDNKDVEIGSTENYIISEDENGEYYISAFTNEGLSKKTLSIPKIVIIDDNKYVISYVAEIFKDHSYVRKLYIEIPTNKLCIKGCNSIRVIQVSQENLIDPDAFFEGLTDIDIYVTDSTYEYDSDADFTLNNNIYYDYSTKLDTFDKYTRYEYIIIGITIGSIIIAVISLIAMIKLIKDVLLSIESNVCIVISCIFLLVYILGTIILFFKGEENNLYFKGTPLLLPFILAIASFVSNVEREDKYHKLFFIGLIISTIGVVINIIFAESKALLLPEIIMVIVLLGILLLIHVALAESKILSYILTIIALLIIIPSIYLCDMLLGIILNDPLIGVIIVCVLIGISLIICKKVFGIEVSYDSGSSSSYSTESASTTTSSSLDYIPYPKFSGFLGTKITLPDDFYWTNSPYVKIKNQIIYISGYIKCSRTYDTEFEAKEASKYCFKKMMESIYSILEDHYYQYPEDHRYLVDASKVEINIEYY